MKQKIVSRLWFFLIFLIVLSFPLASYADVGAKPSLSIHVLNPPGEKYYLDLLIQDKDTYPNLTDEEKAALDQSMLALLYSHENEGWYPAIAQGTAGPLWGSLEGAPEEGGMLHAFSYFGVPASYRVIVVTESGKVAVSETQKRETLQSSITYDYETGKITLPEKTTGSILNQFLTTLILTLVIEGVVLVLFGFSFKKNWKVFLVANLITHAVLTFAVIAALNARGSELAFFIQFPVEIGIIIAETLIYIKWLTGRSTGRRCAYGIVANLASWGIGFLLVYLL